MAKSVFIAEKPSVANEFAKALKINGAKKDGYIESDTTIVTWCVGHLVTMSYPEVYDPALKKWTIETLPFIPEKFKYEVIESVKKQFGIVKNILTRDDVSTIYVCTDSGREGEYIYRLVEQEAQVKDKIEKRVWIDSQTEEEILNGIRTAKDISEYNNLADAAYLRAKEDYLMGINFSRVLTLKYGQSVKSLLKVDKAVISVGRVMTCVLGMVVRREREIREFVETPFYRVLANIHFESQDIEAEWKSQAGSKYFESPLLYKENGFKSKETAEELINLMTDEKPVSLTVEKVDKKKEVKNAPLLYNLAEIQNDCSKMLKISPDETLKIIQELYEKKLVTYPRTDARVLSTAVSKEIGKNISGLTKYSPFAEFAQNILSKEMHKDIAKTKYCDDKQITDHYAIIPTGQGLQALGSIHDLGKQVYNFIVKRFLCIFYPPATYQKITVLLAKNTLNPSTERLSFSVKVLENSGYQIITGTTKQTNNEESNEIEGNTGLFNELKNIKKNDKLLTDGFFIKEGKTSPPKRYNSGSMILAMENAGQLIEDDDLRATIKGSGIGTSATRAEILKKLVNIQYIKLNNKTQIITPTLLGEMVHDIVYVSIRALLNPELTASWEKGLTYVAEGTTSTEEYMNKLSEFVTKKVNGVKGLNNQLQLGTFYKNISNYY